MTLAQGQRQFLRFLLAGSAAALANYFSRFIFSLWFPFEVAVTLAFFVGLASGFVLMRRFAFRSTDRAVGQQAFKYVLVNLIALGLTVGISSLMARFLLPGIGIVQHVEAIAHAFGVGIPVVTSYFGHRLFTFR